MGIHLEEFGFSLLLPPKCGSTSLKLLAFELENDRTFQPYRHNGNWVWVHDLYRSLPFEQQLGMVVETGVRMCVVRDPLDRIVSCHSNRVMHHGELDNVRLSAAERDRGAVPRPDLRTFVEHLEVYRRHVPSIAHHAAPLSRCLGSDAGFYDDVYDLSEMDQLLARIRKLVGRDLPDLGHVQRGGSKYKPAEVAPDVRHMIEDRFAEDYEVFGEFFKTNTVAAKGA